MTFAHKKMGSIELAQAAAENLATHMSWAHERTPGMRVFSDEYLVLADSGLACDTFNTVCRARLTDDTVRERVETAVAYFRSAARPFSWWVGPGDLPPALPVALRSAGLEAAESELAMAIDLAVLDESWAPPPNISIERVRTPEDARHFALINAANWSPPGRPRRRERAFIRGSDLSRPESSPSTSREAESCQLAEQCRRRQDRCPVESAQSFAFASVRQESR